MIEAEVLSRLPDVRHGFFTRRGGFSRGIYASLNCGLGTRDERDNVRRNHAHVATALGLVPGQLVTLHQVHGTEVVTVERPWPWDHRPKADAMVTRMRGIALGVLTADCAPLLFADGEAGVVAAAHAGWRGALAGVCEAVLEAMERHGARRAAIACAIGPCISQPAYEVGPDFVEAFLDRDPDSESLFARGPGDEKPRFDLAGYIARRLELARVGAIERVAGCTYRDEEDFFSYRRSVHRGEPDYGRQISAITLGPDAFLEEE